MHRPEPHGEDGRIIAHILSLRLAEAASLMAGLGHPTARSDDLADAISYCTDSEEYRLLQGSLAAPPEGEAGVVGSWTAGMDAGSLLIRGQIASRDDKLFVFLNYRLIRVINLFNASNAAESAKRFATRFTAPTLRAFPPQALISIGTRSGYLVTDQDKGFGLPLAQPRSNGSIFSLLESTHFINKHGIIQRKLSQNQAWQDNIIAQAAAFSEYFEKRFGYPLFLFYGTLLGQQRANDFIDRDDDLDMAYISRETTGGGVRDEIFRISSGLVDDGYLLVHRNNENFIKPSVSGVSFDIFPGWIRDGKLYMPNTTFMDADMDMFHPLRTVDFKGRAFRIPNRPELFLERKYGTAWRHPDPGYRTTYPQAAKADLTAAKLTPDQIQALIGLRTARAGAAS